MAAGQGNGQTVQFSITPYQEGQALPVLKERKRFSSKFHPVFSFLNYRYFLIGIIAWPDEKTSFIHVLSL